MSLRYDINAIKERDPAARNSLEVLLLYPGLHAIIWHRIAHFFYKRNNFLCKIYIFVSIFFFFLCTLTIIMCFSCKLFRLF